MRTWAPDGETKKWDCINDGQTDKGFFVIQMTDARIRAAMRIKTGLKSTKEADGKVVNAWDGGWEWKWFFDKPAAASK